LEDSELAPSSSLQNRVLTLVLKNKHKHVFCHSTVQEYWKGTTHILLF